MNQPEPPATPCRVSIIIKALNEERHIVAAVESALAAVQTVGGEVVLAESCSSDATVVALASSYPICIVQLAHTHERCCGVGTQLGYQHSSGEFVYILDGDMEMLPGFLPAALAFMQAHPEVAGVGGRVVEMNTSSLEYLARVERGQSHMQAGAVDRLDMGVLYRRGAVERRSVVDQPVWKVKSACDDDQVFKPEAPIAALLKSVTLEAHPSTLRNRCRDW